VCVVFVDFVPKLYNIFTRRFVFLVKCAHHPPHIGFPNPDCTAWLFQKLCLQGVHCAWLSTWLPSPERDKDNAQPHIPSAETLATPPPPPGDLRTIDVPWWVYTASGMHLVFPASLSEYSTATLLSSVARDATLQGDPELQFDREVFPVGVSLADAAIVGVTQRLQRGPAHTSAAAELVCSMSPCLADGLAKS
jgi:hypothetical protein